MKLRLLVTALSALCLGSPLMHAQAADAEHHTELGDHMDKAGKIFKKLRGQIADSSQNASSMDLVAQLHTELAAGLDLKPEKEADLPADQQADFQAKYQAKMKDFLGEVDKLGDLLKANDNEGAAAQLKKLGMDQRSDHKQFRKPKKE